MEDGFVITIDGPAGSGKSTIAKVVASKINFTYLDTGAMYRCVAYLSDKKDFRPAEIAQNLNFEIKNNDNTIRIYANGEDVTSEIRTNKVDNKVAKISKIKEVRKYLIKKQRDFAKKKNVILEGRDTGTVVFPNADIKFYLDASVDIRAERRYNQMNEEKDIKISKIKKDIIKRDNIDKSKKWGALKRAEDAYYIDTTNLSKKEVVGEIISYIKKYED